ncbi:uncharacterized protein CC84DRAFT_1196565 [Paraphaeosphaeria sporulosa]|uniref:NACHT domain-containing protein n=1 Tax=Paraphaeosphaeria sporulosa TaxID=1460663 RepID=A0A177CC48_9PLEO|nr:uncharacterized protein CC84DRAFT_1196565 [Paraphaeosphaeria sporulosa]OAG04338.1 hypothetical protein CC84DRAFT_1196565 [Paraphaeosphaeria sporulosa]
MRLLQYRENGELTIASFDDNELPPYAILSHTWGSDKEEVTFADIVQGSSKAKLGYKKIRFCGEQARQDGLEYFWIDTCCIDKTDKAELSHAIQSIFRWYQNTVRCYVYLSDVSKRKGRFGDMRTEFSWEPSFRASRWFTRSWTLQELLAPSTVVFFSQEWEKLGDKTSLMSLIHKITSIPYEVLNGVPLSQFSVDERLRWNEGRQTKREEDGAYSLQGILDVKLAPVYGEGAAGAFRRLINEIDSSKRCIRDLRSTDPRDDKKRIEQIKGGLVADSYRWILDNTTFQQWQQDPHSRLLWVKGDPGKGKTILLCGIINELQEAANNSVTVSYFFCQATDSRINTATAVLRGLLYMLVDQQPSLISHVRKKHDLAGESLFNDANAWAALTEIFVDVLRDSDLRPTYLIIDALDECVTNLPMLLDFITKQSSVSSRVKWIVSSRNWPDIEAQLERAGHKVRLSLELNAESVAAAVAGFIQQRVDQLAQEKRYTAEVRDAVLQHLTINANDTFLWVALVCQELQRTANWHVLKKLAVFPPGLDDMYMWMMQQVSESDDADICWKVLASVAILYQPVSVPELVALVEQLEDLVDDLESVRNIIGFCGSFLTLREDTVYFVHQSAKDFLFAKAYNEAFSDGIEDVHWTIFSRSLAILSKTLYRDMYSLEAPGIAVENVKPPHPDPLAESRYPCVYWIDHLCDSKTKFLENSGGDLQVTEVLDKFLRTKYLYWLEGLSLCKRIAKGVISITKLWSLVQVNRLSQLVYDAWRFIMYHKGVIECYPLQTYVSALLFSPTGSPIRNLFQHEEPDGIRVTPPLSNGWSACLQTFEGHSHGVTSVAFSHDSTRLASASGDITVKIWDASSGACLLTLEGHSRSVRSVAFSHNSTRLVSASSDKTVKIWDASSGVCLQTLEGHSSAVRSVAFSHESTRLVSASDDSTVKIWDASSGVCLQTLEGHSSAIRSTLTVAKSLDHISFDTSGLYLHTDIGPIRIIGPSDFPPFLSLVEPQDLGLALSANDVWIRRGSQNLVWLPSEFRPLSSAVSGKIVGVGVGNGRGGGRRSKMRTYRF